MEGETMQRLARVNRTQAFLGTLALVVLGLFRPGWVGSAILFTVVIVLLAVLVRTSVGARPGTVLARLVILAGLAAIAVYKII